MIQSKIELSDKVYKGVTENIFDHFNLTVWCYDIISVISAFIVEI